MSVSAIINLNELNGVDIPTRLIDLPVSFQRIYHAYWEPIIDRLELPTLRYIGILDVDIKKWDKVKHELL